MAKPLTPSELREFRKQVKVLRDKGIIGKTDLRNVQPSWVRGGRPLKELVKEFRPVIQGTAEAIPAQQVNPSTRRIEQKVTLKNYKTGKKQTFVVVGTGANESVHVDEYGNVIREHAGKGIQTISVAVPYKDLEQWTESAMAEHYEKLGCKGWGFKFGVGDRWGYSQFFRNIDQMFAQLIEYLTRLSAYEGSPYYQKQIFRNLELYRVYSKEAWFAQKEAHAERKSGPVKSEYKGKKKARRRKKR